MNMLVCGSERVSASLQGNRKKVTSKIVIMSLCAALVSGCGSTVKQTFDLSPAYKSAAAVKTPRRRLQILVANPGALKTLDGQDIVIREAGGSVAYLKKAQWSDRLTNIVQMRLLQALEDTGHFAGVGRPGDGLNANYQLITDLRVFSVDVDSQGKFANVEIAARLMDDKTGNVRKSHVFSARKRLEGSGNANYAAALDQAFSVVLQDIVHWTERAL